MPRRSDFLTSIASCSYPSIAFEYFYEENAPGTAYDNLGFFVNEILISLAASGAGVLNRKPSAFPVHLQYLFARSL